MTTLIRDLIHFEEVEEVIKLRQAEQAREIVEKYFISEGPVWSWWQAHRSPQIDPDGFAATPALAFLHPDYLANCWPAYPNLWSLDERLEGRRATLKYVEPGFFTAALFELLPT